jgi:hypothetical protein
MIATLTALALLLQMAAPQAEVEVRAVAVPDSVKIGEEFTLSVYVSGFAEGSEVVFPELPDTGSVTALGPPLVGGDQPTDTLLALYELAAWKAGDLQVPEAELVIIRDGAELTIPLPEVTVRVVSVLPLDADPDTLAWEPPADVVGANWSLRDKLIGAGLALAALLIGFVYLRRRVAAYPVTLPPAKTPSERALDALELIAQSGLIEAGELKGFYSALSFVLRQFLADTEYEWGLDLTTSEVVNAVASDGVTDQAVALLGVLLIEADTVKFARRRPSRGRAGWALDAAHGWVADFERVDRLPDFVLEPDAELEEALTVKREAGLSIDDSEAQLEEIDDIFADDAVVEGEASETASHAEDTFEDDEQGKGDAT